MGLGSRTCASTDNVKNQNKRKPDFVNMVLFN